MAEVKCALIQQVCEIGNVEKNVETASRLITEAAGNGANIICLQELFNTGFFCTKPDRKIFDLAETIPGPTTERIGKVARETNTVVIAPIFEMTIPGEYYNSAAVIGPDGEVIGTYRKMHIPDLFSEEYFDSEKPWFKVGNLGYPVFDTPFGARIGILICYDRHFPEAVRCLALKGAEILFSPIASGGEFKDIMRIEGQAHAVANRFYVGICASVGTLPVVRMEGANRTEGDFDDEFPMGGGSFFAGPGGEIISAAADPDDVEQIVYADIDTSAIPRARLDSGFFRNRRPDSYGALGK